MRRTWLATALFTVGVAVAWSSLLTPDPLYVVIGTAPGLVITPLLWWPLNGRRERATYARGVIAGTLIVSAIWAVGFTLTNLFTMLTHPHHGYVDKSWADFGVFVVVGFGIVGGAISIPLGTALGILVIWVERVLAPAS